MSYSYSPVNAHQCDVPSSRGKLAAAALLAISAGACFGVAATPAISSLFTTPAPTTVVSRVAVPISSRNVVSGAPVQSQHILEAVDNDVVYEVQSSTSSSVGILAGGLVAAAASALVFALRGSSKSKSEQLAIAAVFGTKKAAPAPAKASKPVTSDRPLWYPTAVAPDYLDGSLPGDRGFDPLGLSKPVEYLQYGFDELDQNAPKNRAGGVVGTIKPTVDQVSTDPLQPYSEVFGLQRFRECELLHGRWAMLGVLGVLVAEAVTGVQWQDAGLVEAQQAVYWGNELPFTNTQIVWFEVLSMGFVEIFRNTELDLEKRCYPGGAFDPLGLAAKDEATTFRLKEAELKHGRLAMIAFLGFAIAAGKTGLGATMAFNSFANSFN